MKITKISNRYPGTEGDPQRGDIPAHSACVTVEGAPVGGWKPGLYVASRTPDMHYQLEIIEVFEGNRVLLSAGWGNVLDRTIVHEGAELFVMGEDPEPAAHHEDTFTPAKLMHSNMLLRDEDD